LTFKLGPLCFAYSVSLFEGVERLVSEVFRDTL
jgi:hypothetical protein